MTHMDIGSVVASNQSWNPKCSGCSFKPKKKSSRNSWWFYIDDIHQQLNSSCDCVENENALNPMKGN